MDYSAKYFKESLPEWKKRKDPILSRLFYRPVSFYISSIATKLNISANQISYFSTILAVVACISFLFNSFIARLFGSILINLWLILDCADGNIARSIKKQPFGEFADATSSYILVSLMCITISFSVYFTGGILFDEKSPWIIFIGAVASISDTLMRLVYQKYTNVSLNLQSSGIIPIQHDKRIDNNCVGSFRVRIEAELGIGGVLPLAILFATIFNALDLIIIYCLLYYGLSCIISILTLINNAIKLEKMQLK